MKSEKADSNNVTKREPIALVGIGCRFPGDINGPDQLWQGLKTGVDAITDVPESRWKINSFYDPDPNIAGKVKTKKGGFLKEVDKFDADFFGIYPKTAERIDPQQRLLLEVTYEAFEDAGIRLEDVSGSKTAVYIGVFTNDYWDIQAASEQKNQLSPQVSMGVILTAIANRLSYTYNLKGPSVTIDTACSSSLVAVHMACQSIWSGESRQAIAGGVNAILRPETSIMMSKGNFLSPDGYCKSFDSRANGYVRSEGCGIVILKPLSQAVADGDHIYGQILATAVNQDGHTESGFTVPSLDSQMDMLKTAYAKAGVDPDSVAYVEAHGTGTPVGDPIETNAFGNIIGKNRKTGNECIIGSIKTNLGHLEAAAGVAGLIKLALILKHKQIPKNLHFLNPNPKIPFDDYKLKVSTRLQELPENGQPAVCGVNSFGAGGTNAHVVMKGYQPENNGLRLNGSAPAEKGAYLFTMTARSEGALKDNAKSYIDFVKTSPASLEDICYSAASRRSMHPHRFASAVKSKDQLIENLEAFLEDEKRPGMHAGQLNRSYEHKVGFIFSGQGPQWFAMGRQLIRTSQLFKNVILKVDKLFSELADWSLLEEMNKDEEHSRIGETNIAQPAIMAVQIGLAELWKSRGVEPQGCVGHSIGEVAAAYTAGALTIEQAVQVIYHRSRGQNRASNKGKMLAVGLPYSRAKNLINDYRETVSVAAINGPSMVTLSGDAGPLESIAQNLERQDIFHRFLRVNVPFHSHHMAPLKDKLISSLAQLRPSMADMPLYSTVTGNKEDGKHLDSEYWYKNVRQPVFFTDALQAMIDDGYNTFIEIAPHPILTNGALELLRENKFSNALIVPSLRRREDEDIISMGSLAALFTSGFRIDPGCLFPENARYVKLPAYRWQHQTYWFETEANQNRRIGEEKHPFLLEDIQMISNPRQIQWDLQLDRGIHPYLTDHKVEGTVIFPGTGHLEAAFAAAKASFPLNSFSLENIKFGNALFIPEEGEIPKIKLEISPESGKFRLFSKKNNTNNEWARHSRGNVVFQKENPALKRLDLEKIKSRVKNRISVSNFYLEMKQHGLEYGETFRGVQKLWSAEMALLGEVELHENLQYGAGKYHFHPALLDACLHILEYAGHWATESDQPGIYLPASLKRYEIYGHAPDKVWCYIEVREAGTQTLKADYFIMDYSGTVIAELQGLECNYVEGSRGEKNIDVYDGFYDYVWDEVTVESGNADKISNNSLLIFQNQGELGKQIVTSLSENKVAPTTVAKAANFSKINERRYTVNPDLSQDLEKLLLEINHNQKIEKIVYLWPLDTPANPYLSDTELEEQQQSLVSSMLLFLQAIIKSGNGPALSIVVQSTEKVLPTDKVNINQAAVYGLGRVLLNEYPFMKVSIIDISEFPSDTEIRNLSSHLAMKNTGEVNLSEIAFRNDFRYVRKLVAVDRDYAEAGARTEINARNTAFAVEVHTIKNKPETTYRKIRRPLIKENEVEVEVHAMAVDDVQFKRNDQSFMPLSDEFAGIVTKTGKDVDLFVPGDEVIVLGKNNIGGIINARKELVLPKPDSWSLVSAAKWYKPLFSALYGLKYLGEVKKDDLVFIESPFTTVELAASRIAKQLGAKIITVSESGSADDPQNSMESIISVNPGEDAEEKILSLSGGKGIKVMIAGGKVHEVIGKCLAPFAKIIDLSPHSRQTKGVRLLQQQERNISFHQIDIESLLIHKADKGQKIAEEIGQLAEIENAPDAPVDYCPVHLLPGFLKKFTSDHQSAKCILTFDQSGIPLSPAKKLTVEANATYLITGGASGFGLILAKWLADNGAKNLALLSRSGCKYDRDYEMVDAMQACGVNVHLMNVDVTSQKEVALNLNIIRESMPPLRGIIHSAAVLDDGIIPNMDMDKFMRVFNPKVKGAWNLHVGTQQDDLDFFIMLSSVSSVIGWPGQANYSSANNFLDRLALYRQSMGMVGSSINLGVLDDYAGMTKSGEDGNLINVLYNQGWVPLSLKEVTDMIGTILMQNPVQRMAANLDWSRFKDSFPHLSNDSRFKGIIDKTLRESEGQNSGGSLPVQLKEGDLEEKEQLLVNNIAASLAKILGVSTEKIAVDVPITNMGLDSLMLNQLRNWIQQKLELNYPLMRIAKGPSIYELAGQLLTDLQEANGAEKNENGQNIAAKGHNESFEYVGKWFLKNKLAARAVNFRIFCIHPVGAGASMFSHFLYHAPENTEVMAYQLPGRENRSGEAPFEKMEELIHEMANAIEPFLDKPFLILGHSFGGIIGFELIHYLRENYGVQPQHLFVTGTCAPHLTQEWKKTETISETAVVTNSTEKLLGLLNYIDDVDFLKSILPVMKKDMPLIMSYPYRDRGLLNFPVTAFAAEKDEVVTIKEVASWADQTSSTFNLEIVDGDHWFLSRNKEFILENLQAAIDRHKIAPSLKA